MDFNVDLKKIVISFLMIGVAIGLFMAFMVALFMLFFGDGRCLNLI